MMDALPFRTNDPACTVSLTHTSTAISSGRRRGCRLPFERSSPLVSSSSARSALDRRKTISASTVGGGFLSLFHGLRNMTCLRLGSKHDATVFLTHHPIGRQVLQPQCVIQLDVAAWFPGRAGSSLK